MAETYLEIVSHPLLWVFACVAAVMLVIWWLLDKKLSQYGRKLGLGFAAFPIVLVGGMTWLVIFITLLLGLYKLILELIWYPALTGKDALWDWRFALAQIAALTTILGAVIALPLTLNRLILTRRQTETAENQLFNNKLNSATTDLAARHQVTREIGRGKDKRILTEWQDDLLARAAAIDRLEGLAEERQAEAPRIARVLSLYVRELTRIHAAEPPPQGAHMFELSRWASKLQQARPDIQSAAQSLGRLQQKNFQTREPVSIDLRRASLLGFNMRDARLRGAQLEGAALYCVDLQAAQLQGADLKHARLDRANLSRAQLQEADFAGALLVGADLSFAQLKCAKLRSARLSQANLRSANLHGAQIANAIFKGAQLQQADLSYVDFSEVDLRGAKLNDANLEGALLDGLSIDQGTSLANASVWKAALRDLSFNVAPQLLEHIDLHTVFGDASIRFPDGSGPENPNWPKHWPRFDLRVSFDGEWRKWQADPDRYVPPEPQDQES